MARFVPLRRRLVQGITAALMLPSGAWAQDRETRPAGTPGPLLTAKRRALVIGNGRYPEDPLRNPLNDARAIAEELARAGFQTTIVTDASRADMIARIRDYGNALAREKAVGLFYFAGHGIQLSWRNYLLPVDAVLQTMDDVPKAAVDLGILLDGLKRAGNPANVVILDACRNNPFRRNFIVPQAGLSQVDAPPGSLLAYATAPGNVAADGEGDNGLYTGHLLREMRVPDAKIEDVFKRVRLAVRRGSNGSQIPWESTSLEEDFYFLPPKKLKELAEAERARRFEEELRLWESVKEAKEPGPVEDYLRRYPNGEFSELAQRALDVALAAQGEKRIEVQSPAGNPYTQGYARADTDFKAGDFYRYRVLDLETRAPLGKLPGVITAVTETRVIIGKGALVLDRMGNTLKTVDGFRYTDNQNMPLEFYVGRKWTTRYRVFPPGVPETAHVIGEAEYRVTGREAVEVPAGRFDCFRIEGHGRARGPKGGTGEFRSTAWYAPEKCRRHIALDIVRRPVPGSPLPHVSSRHELVAFRQT
jgi:uncharacterized caspase-like protein